MNQLRVLIACGLLLLNSLVYGQSINLTIQNEKQQPIEGATIMIENVLYGTTNPNGTIALDYAGNYPVTLNIFKQGYMPKTTQLNAISSMPVSLTLIKSKVSIKEITVTGIGTSTNGNSSIQHVDKLVRPVNSSQDLLQLVPGLFIAQHAGGGKAEQIFIRGFDCDHGTDFNISVDGLPVNMVSHAHGQGYADFHFVIPETIDKLNVYKGPYNARFGDFSTSGTGEFITKNSIDQNEVKLEGGMFDTYRALAMIDVLGKKSLFSKEKENLYVTGEYVYTNSYFQSKQDFNRYNLFGKYTGMLTSNTQLQLSISTFKANWYASGQIPQRAIEQNLITRYGSIDDTEGGTTSRSNATLSLKRYTKNNAIINHQLYYVKYDFNLYSNFTFYSRDSIHGDGIQQTDNRHIGGYVGTYNKTFKLLNTRIDLTSGINSRNDMTNLVLANQSKRTTLDTVVSGKITQHNLAGYTDAAIHLTDKFTINTGLRVDYFIFNFKEKNESALSGNKSLHRFSPKLNFSYLLPRNALLFWKNGIGFHSNDARSIVINRTNNSLPRAYGSEVGSEFKIGKNILLHTAVWALYLESELVYVGDEGVVETSSPTMRTGIDLSIRAQLNKNLVADMDINYNHALLTDAPKGENFIPLAPAFTSTGGLTYSRNSGWYGSLRYKHIRSRAANEDYSITAHGFFLVDALVGYKFNKFELGSSIENVLNTKWNQAQFETESRMKHEQEAVNELHFTPGTPFFAKAFIKLNF
ncbi:MAG: TonB-dependent receptor plug domain-containing protein [Bacteroidetes bacterium]|nr:TonB-dependent receptor plug domain-containing protein [Bacteroidota bacterium]